MRKKGSKQSKVSRIDRSKALAAQADEAIKERIRTAPAYMYTSLCPVPEEDIFINSILKSKLRSVVMIGHIDKCLKLLEDEECRKNTHEKYLAFKYFYLDGMTYESIAEIYGYGERTARRWITELTGILSVYLFGADALMLD